MSAETDLTPIEPERLLTISAETLDDLERLRIATTNRIKALERGGVRKDVAEFKRATDAVEDKNSAAMLVNARKLAAAIHAAEKIAIDLLTQDFADVYPELHAFTLRTRGLGVKTVARLIGKTSDPGGTYMTPVAKDADGNVTEWAEVQRTVSKLWAYCGLHVIDGQGPRRRKGQQANWSTPAKTRSYLIAEACMKNRASPYRAVYDHHREKHEDAVHEYPCAQCGVKGKPAVVGSPLRDGHKHARAMRATAKAVLRDLFRVSKGLEPRFAGPAD